MYDSIEMYLQREKPSDNFIKSTSQQYLTWVTQGENGNGYFVSGYLGTLQVKITETGIKIGKGSLCKFYKGNNIETLTRTDTKLAIEKISDYLNLPIEKANITRIDFAANLFMKYQPAIYFQYLNELRYFNRLIEPDSLYYVNKSKRLQFYDKLLEQKARKEEIPKMYENMNILRVEMRYLNRVRQKLKEPKITAEMLFNKEFYSKLVNEFQNIYFAIQKGKPQTDIMEATTTRKVFIDELLSERISEIGQAKLLAMIKERQITGKITKKQAYDLRHTVMEHSNIPIGEQSNELINELDQKIKEVASNNL